MNRAQGRIASHAFTLLGLVFALAACGGITDSAAGRAGSACTTTSDCAYGNFCGYLISDRCGATGHCVTTPSGLQPGGYTGMCGCDGSAIAEPFAYGPYAPAPVRSTSAFGGCEMPDAAQ